MDTSTLPNVGTSSPEHPGNGEQQTDFRVLTYEEQRALKQCGKEARWRRAYPGAAVGAGLLYTLRRSGIVGPSGLALKYFLAGLGGFFFGLASYARECARRLDSLPAYQARMQHLTEERRRRQSFSVDGTVRSDSVLPLSLAFCLQDA